VLAPPNISKIKPESESKGSLFAKAASKKSSLFGAFEGLVKQLQNTMGNEKSPGKEVLSAAQQKLAQVNNLKKAETHLQADKLRDARQLKPSGSTIRNDAAALKEGTAPKSDSLSSTLPKKQQLLTPEDGTSFKDQDTQHVKKQRESLKNNAAAGTVKDSGSEQNGQVLAAYSALGVQVQQNKLKPDAKEVSQDAHIKKADKTRDRRKERIDVEVYDLRTQVGEQKNKPSESAATQDTATKTVELTLHLKEGAEKKADNPQLAPAQGPSRSFQDLLAQELRSTMNGEIVRHASMVLKDGGEGLIRLNLKPESLGNVRIRLEMSDHKVTGHILVETEEALRAFEKEIHSLEQAFKDGGFQGASLEVSVSADGRGSGSFQQGQMQQPFYSERLIATTYDSTMPELISATQNSSSSSGPNVSINMLA
jgi:hypothetical protein